MADRESESKKPKIDRRRHEQADVDLPILEILEHRSSLTTIGITEAVKAHLPIFPADRVRAAQRENESKIDQIIANALQSGRRLSRDGLIERVERGEFRITAVGRAHLSHHREEVESGLLMLKQIIPKGLRGD